MVAAHPPRLVLDDAKLRLDVDACARPLSKPGWIRTPIEHDGARWACFHQDGGYLLAEVVVEKDENLEAPILDANTPPAVGVACFLRGSRHVFTGRVMHAVMPVEAAVRGKAWHPLASAFPRMAPFDLGRLAEDIKRNGLIEPIVLLDDQVIDGRHRQEACFLAGRDPVYVDFDESLGDPIDWAISKNLHRRHLTASQRALIATELPGIRDAARARQEASRAQPGQRVGERNAAPASRGKAAAEAAEQMDVSTRSVEQAQRVKDHGADEVIEAVRDGRIPVSTAADLVGAEPEEQRRLVSLDDPKAVKRAAREIAAQERAVRQAQKNAKAIEDAKKLDANPVGVDILEDADMAIALAQERGGARLVIVDAPWDRYEQQSGVAHPELSYPTLTLHQIGDHLDAAAEAATSDARMVVWITCPLLAEALASIARALVTCLGNEAAIHEDSPWRRIVRPRGWSLVSIGAWFKTAEGEVVRNGNGHHWRGATEIALLFTRTEGGPVNCAIPNASLAPRTKHSQKPVEWTREWLRAWTDPGDLVLVPYLGLGGDAIACVQEQRACIAAEKHEGRRADARLALAAVQT